MQHRWLAVSNAKVARLVWRNQLGFGSKSRL
jgi:hypothetical protein